MSDKVVKKTMVLEWKAFPVSLPTFEAWCRANCADYCGCSAGSDLQLHFTEDSQDQADAAQAKWDSIETSADAMATAYVAAADVKGMADALKADAAAKSWDQLSAAQRKLVMNVALSDAEIKAAHDALGA